MGRNRRGGAPMQGRDLRYRMEVDFLEAAKGVTKRVTMPDGKTLDVTIPEGLRDGQSCGCAARVSPASLVALRAMFMWKSP